MSATCRDGLTKLDERVTETGVRLGEVGRMAEGARLEAELAIQGGREAEKAARTAQEKAAETERIAALADAAARTAKEKVLRIEQALPPDSRELFARSVRAVGWVWNSTSLPCHRHRLRGSPQPRTWAVPDCLPRRRRYEAGRRDLSPVQQQQRDHPQQEVLYKERGEPGHPWHCDLRRAAA